MLIDWNWTESARQLGQILAAFILTLPIAWNREQADRVMGIGAAVALGREIAVLLALAGLPHSPLPEQTET